LFGILSHDLRSPIANLITLLHLKKDGVFENKKDEQGYTNNVIQSAEQLLENMETLLLWSKGQMQNFQPNYHTISVSELFRYIERFFEHEKQISIEFSNPQNLEIFSDELFLQVIMQNLTSNAIKALKTTQEPVIKWSAIQTDEGIRIQISDNGPGMDEQKLKDLLTVNQTLSQKNGLGLQIVNDLTKVIHCTLNFSTAPGKGFTTVLLFDDKIEKQ
ncbi:MAG: HAMP domain-containing histidine kinase, partial [Ignavibacteria bacterium]|nr:HAMP domain-containing histidine kinase [Ignavibacteria bacterium]